MIMIMIMSPWSAVDFVFGVVGHALLLESAMRHDGLLADAISQSGSQAIFSSRGLLSRLAA
jgi:hypothetical protein